MKHYLKLDKNFKPCPYSEEDELFYNGIFVFNISRMLGYIRENPDLFMPEVVAVKDINYASSKITYEHLDSVDVSNPVILAEIAPDRYNLIDGHHRVAEAARHNLDTIKAYRLKTSQHMYFFISREGYEKFVEYWNSKIMGQ